MLKRDVQNLGEPFLRGRRLEGRRCDRIGIRVAPSPVGAHGGHDARHRTTPGKLSKFDPLPALGSRKVGRVDAHIGHLGRK